VFVVKRRLFRRGLAHLPSLVVNETRVKFLSRTTTAKDHDCPLTNFCRFVFFVFFVRRTKIGQL
jgi:hypothetical protein